MNIEKKYWINNKVFSCQRAGKLILLDVNTDNYYMIEKKDMPIALSEINNKIFSSNDNLISTNQATGRSQVIDELLNCGLITPHKQQGKFLEPITVSEPATPFEHVETDQWPRIAWHHVVFALSAGLYAQIILKLLPLRTIISHISKINPHKQSTKNAEHLLYIARIYKRLRPILFKSRICLFDSLAFTIFCRFYGARPTIVFGVIDDPFEAHCWVQQDGIILNDVPQNIKQYTTIMAV